MISLWHWHTEPFLVGGTLLFGWLYALLVGPLRAQVFGLAGVVPDFPRGRALAFYGGLLSLYAAVGSPLDAVGENFLFSAHMLQHNVLMYVCGPLFVAGIPTWMCDSLFTRLPTVERAGRFLTHPIVGGVIFTFIFTIWHVPRFYEAALHNKPLHIFEHLSMLFGSVLMWWPILSPSRHLQPISVWAQCLFVFALMVAQTPIFGFLVFSGHVLYPTYEYAARIPWLTVDPLQDQVLGGVVMKAANMGVSLVIMARAFLTWR